ncbi:hypothetical protein HYV73_02455 [Candidatus Uhrbacteria bacterium]|nr:hypothetical protein [Candidatus Uhrbacteria bacterium]
MGEWNFNTRQCIRALKRLGFFLCNKRHGRHDKLCPPQTILNRLTGLIMIPRHSKLHCQSEIVAELRKMGSELLVERFKKM